MFFTMGVLLKTNNMKISELIKKLQEIQKEDGDIESYYLYRDDYCNTDYMRFFVINQRLFIE